MPAADRDCYNRRMKKITNILVQVDARRDEQILLSHALELAKQHGAAVKLVDIVPEFSWPVRFVATDYDEIRQAVIRQKEEEMEKLASPIQNQGVNLTWKVLFGRSSDQIIGEVVSAGHDLVMKDAKGQHSPHTGSFGTTALRLIRYCPCPVFAFRPRKATAAQDKIAVAVDATAPDEAHATLNREILEWATAIAGDTPIHVVHAWSVYGEGVIKDYMKRDEFATLVKDAEQEAHEQLDKLLAPLQLPPGRLHRHLVRGGAATELSNFLNTGGFDMLVLGTVARTGISGLFMGNTAETLLDRVNCSVVAIKPAGFKTPIHTS